MFDQLFKAQLEQLASDPASPKLSQVWYNTTENVAKYYDGTAIRTLPIKSYVDSLNTTVTDNINTHKARVDNPHSVTPLQVGNATAQWNASKLQGLSISSGAPSNKQALIWNADSSIWEAQSQSGGVTKVTFYDPVTTTLPTGTSFTVDGIAIANGESVLFGGLSNKI